jgi:hypothetical protein
MSEKTTGSCLCGSIKYSVKGDFEIALNCHCNICKKNTGGAFEAIALINQESIVFIEGKDNLKKYIISDKANKYFCVNCGTPIYNIHANVPGKAIVHIGSLDNPSCIIPSINIHAENMLPWVLDIKEMKTFDQDINK